MPPHFHVRTPDGNAQIRLDTLEIMRGTLDRKDLAAVREWADEPGSRAALWVEWRRLNERD
ncbi:MAG: DUF4160 domain-containing protein [Roseiarcus sp.]